MSKKTWLLSGVRLRMTVHIHNTTVSNFTRFSREGKVKKRNTVLYTIKSSDVVIVLSVDNKTNPCMIGESGALRSPGH